MTPPIAKSLLSCTCALFLTAALAQPTEAGAFFHYAGYGPGCCGSYYTAYAPSYYGYYGVGYRGYGLWGTSYASYYAPSYAYSSYYGPSYAYSGSGCGTCGYGSCGYGCGSCGIGCGSCGACDSSCGSCYDGCGSCYSGCGSCYGGCGIACADGCGTGVSSPAAEPQAEPNKPYTPPEGSSDRSTFEQDPNGRSEPFTPPRTPGGGTGEITPNFGNDTQIERGANKPPVEEESPEQTIEQKQVPAPAEPGAPAEEASESDNPPEPPAAEVEGPMVELPSGIATAASPTRARLNYTVRFLAPKVARVDIAPNRHWLPVETETRLAANK